MASWLSREIDGDEDRLPPLKQKSKIPVRVTRLSSDSEKSSSSEDEGDKKQRLPRDSVDKLQNKRPSRIPIVDNQKKNKIDKKKLPVATVKGEKPLGRDSGINLQETQGRQARTKTSTSPPSAAKSSSRKPGNESTPQVRRRIPRQLTPLEITQVSKDEKEPRNEASASDSSSAARTGDVTPDFECNIARVEDGDLLTGAESNISGSEFDDDFERYSISSDEQAMPNVPPWLRGAVKEHKRLQEQKAAKAVEDEKNAPKVNTYPAPKDICTDFIADELDKIVADLSDMNADMTDEEHADAMAALLLLRDEAREREQVSKDTKCDIDENKNGVKDDATIKSCVNDTKNPEFETVDNMDENAASEEEFDCSSVTVSSEGERKIAALDEKSRQLKAQFAEENRQTFEYLDMIREEIKQSQEREERITNEINEVRQRHEELNEDLKRLDEISKRRELDEKKWKEKSDKRKKKIEGRLEKLRILLNENSESQEHPVVKNVTERQEDKKCKDPATKETKSFSNEDLSNQILYEPHEVKEYTSVRQLEKTRKEQRRLERMEKKAIKREKLEQRERKKIEKEKRKAARKLEKLRAKNSTVPKENLESSDCVNNQPTCVSSAPQQGNSDGLYNINRTEQQNTQFTEICDGDEIEHDASHKAGDQDTAEGHSSLHLHNVQTNFTSEERKALEDEHFDTSEEVVKKIVFESNTSVLDVPELGPEEAETVKQRSFKFEKDNDLKVATDGSVEEELEKKPSIGSVKEYSKASNHSDEQQKRSFDDNQVVDEDASDDVEMECLEKEDTLKDVSVELFSIEEELNIQTQSDLQGKGEPAEKQFLSHDWAAIPVSTEYDEACSLQGEMAADKQCDNDGRAVMSHTPKEPTSEQSVEEIIGSYSSDKELSQGADKASVQLQKPGFFTTNTSPLESAPEGFDAISSEIAQHQIYPEEETVMKTSDFDLDDGGCDDFDDPMQCPIYEKICVDDKEVSTCSKDKQSQDGDSDGSEVMEECVVNEYGDHIDMSLESNESYGNDDPNAIQGSSPVTNEPSPLVRKPSGRLTASGLQPFFQSPDIAEGEPIFDGMESLIQEEEENVQCEDSRSPFYGKSSPLDYEEVVTPSGLQPFFQSPETAEGDLIFDDMDSSIQDVEENVQSEESQVPFDEDKSSPLDYEAEEVVQHLETRSIEDEGNSWSNGCDMSFNNLPRGIQEALLQQCGVCTDEDEDEKVEVEIIYEEISRRSSDPNSFSIVCEEVSLKHCDEEGLMGQDKDAEIDDVSLNEPFSDENEERLLTFVERDDVDNTMNEESVDVCETKAGMEKSENKVGDGCDHSIEEEVMEFEEPPGTASESLLGGSSPLHVSSLLASTAEDESNSEPPEKPEAFPVEALCPSTLASRDLQKYLPRTTSNKHVYNSKKIANNTSAEDDFIAKFDNFLDEVEEALEVEESIDGTKTERLDVLFDSSTLREKDNLPLKLTESIEEKEASPGTVSKPLVDHDACAIAVQDDNIIEEIGDRNSHSDANTTDKPVSWGPFHDLLPSVLSKGKKEIASEDANQDVSTEKPSGPNNDTNSCIKLSPSLEEIHEDNTDSGTNNKLVVESKETDHHNRSAQSDNSEDVEDNFLDTNSHPVTDTTKGRDYLGMFNGVLHSDVFGGRGESTSEDKAWSDNENLEINGEQKLVPGSDAKPFYHDQDVNKRDEVSDAMCSMEGPLAKTKVQDESHSTELGASHKITEELKEEKAQSEENSSQENAIESINIVVDSQQTDSALSRAKVESSDSKIQYLHSERNIERLLTFVERDDVDISMTEASVDVCETKAGMEKSKNKVGDGCDHSIDVEVMELDQLPGTASESLSEGSSPLHVPSLLVSSAENDDNSELPEELEKAVPVKEPAFPSTDLGTLANSDLQKYSPRNTSSTHVYNSQKIANNTFEEDGFIAEFDDFLDKVEEDIAMDESIDGAKTEQAEGALSRARVESSESKIQDLYDEENKEVMKSHSIVDTGDKSHHWDSFTDMLSSDIRGVTYGNKQFVFEARGACNVDTEGCNKKNEKPYNETTEHDARSPSPVETSKPTSPQGRNHSLPFPRHNESLNEHIMVVAEQVKPPNNQACALEIQHGKHVFEEDTDDDLSEGLDSWGSFYDLALPTGHQDISLPQVDDKARVVGEEFKSKLSCDKPTALHLTTAKDSNCKENNKMSASDVRAAGSVEVPVEPTMDQRFDTSLKDASPVDYPSTAVTQLPHVAKRCLSEKGKVKQSKHNEDEFIDDFDRFLDEVEEDIRIEESMSSSRSNPKSPMSNKIVEENDDESSAYVDVETLDESFTSVTDVASDKSLLSSCDEEVAAINDRALQAISEEDEDPDSWDALDDLVNRRFRSRESCLHGAFVLNYREDRQSDERWRTKYERSIPAVINISEQLLHEELLGAFEAVIWNANKEDGLEEQINLCASSPRNGISNRTNDFLPKKDTNTSKRTEEKKRLEVTNQTTDAIDQGERAIVADAIEDLNKLHSKVTDIRERLSGRTGTKVQIFSPKMDVDSVPVLLDSIRMLDGNIGDLDEEFKHASENSNEASRNREEDVEMEIVVLKKENAKMLEESREENTKLLVQITVLQEEVEAFRKKNEALQKKLEESNVDLKRLHTREEYKDRELTNLKNDFERKEKKWEEAEESLDYALTEKQELLDDVDYLEDNLRDSRECNEQLNARVDELNEMIKELRKKEAMGNKQHEYGHLREEVELLKGSMELSNHREKLLRCKVDALETEVSYHKNCEQTFKSDVKTLEDEKSRILDQLKEQLARAGVEKTRMIAELSRVSDKDKMLSELNGENIRVINERENQLAKLTEENSRLTKELSKALDKGDELTELRGKTSRVIKQLEDQLATVKKENFTLTTKLAKVEEKDKQLAELRKENSSLNSKLEKASEKDKELIELRGEGSRIIKQLEGQVTTLSKENYRLTMELSEASEKDKQLAELRKENSTLTMERSKALDKDNELIELRGETARVIKQLEEQLAELRRENFTLNTELWKVAEKNKQLNELKCETSRETKQLEDQLAKLEKENLTLTTELSKVAEKDKLLTELWDQVKNLRNQNKFLQDEALEARKRFVNESQSPQEQISEICEDSMRSRKSHSSKNPDIKMLRKRVRQNEQEIEFLGRFIRQRGLEYGERPRYNIDQDLKDEPEELLHVKNTLNHLQENERDQQRKRQVQEMEKVIEDLRKSLRQTESDLEQIKDALTLKTERTDFLERRVEEKEMLVEETSKRLNQNEYKLQQTETTLKEQLERAENLQNQLKDMEKLRETTVTAVMSKEQELEEAYHSISKKDEKIDDLIHELKQERLDKECLKRAIEVTETNADREKGLLEKIRDLEHQLQKMGELKETTLAFLMYKEQELEQVNRSLNNKDVQIDGLIKELKQERSDKDCLKKAIADTECKSNREEELLERVIELETQFQEMEELREKTLTSLNSKEQALEQAHVKIDELNLELKREKSDKENLRRAVEVMECNAKREKKLLEATRAELENQLRDIKKLQETTETSLKSKEQELQQVYSSISRKDVNIDELTQELKQERTEMKGLREAMEISESNARQQRLLLHDKEKEVDELNELLCDYERKIENLNVNMKQMRKELEIAEELVTYRQNEVGNTGISSRVQHDQLDVFPIKIGRNTDKNFREIGSLMRHVGERLKKLLQRQKEVDASAILLKQKEAETGRILDRLRGELKQRDDEIESLKTSLGKSVNDGECTKRRLRDLEHENIDLKRSFGDEADKVKKLEMTVKQLVGDLQRAQKSLEEREKTLEETKESLLLKGSLLASMEGKLCLRDHDIESLTLASKERGYEMERLETYLKEVKKELEISTSITTKQNEELVYLKSCAKRKTRDAEEMKFRVQPTQDELKLLSIRLESAKNEKANLSREMASAAARLENEQVMADRQKKALQEQVNSGLKDLKTKTKLIWDMKMRLQESTARITRLEAEKLEQDRCFRDYKRKLACGVKRLKQSLNSANENKSLLQSKIGLTGREMSELRRENQRLKIELLQKEIGKLPQDGEEDTSSGVFKETDLDARRREAVRRLKDLESVIKGGMTTGGHGEMDSLQRSSDTRMERQDLDRCVSSRGAATFNSSAVLSAADRIASDPTTPRSANKISILLCAA